MLPRYGRYNGVMPGGIREGRSGRVAVGNGSYVPRKEDGSLVPVLERFPPFRDGYILRCSDAGQRPAVPTALLIPINAAANI